MGVSCTFSLEPIHPKPFPEPCGPCGADSSKPSASLMRLLRTVLKIGQRHEFRQVVNSLMEAVEYVEYPLKNNMIEFDR
jgi:hypothetical protein